MTFLHHNQLKKCHILHRLYVLKDEKIMILFIINCECTKKEIYIEYKRITKLKSSIT